MPISTETPSAEHSHKPAAQPSLKQRIWQVRNVDSFASRHFHADDERLFWQEQQAETTEALKTALPLAASCLLALIALDAINSGWPIAKIAGQLSILLTALFLLASRYWLPRFQEPADVVAKRCAMLFALDLNGILLTNGSPVFYPHAWIGLLPIYFFCYGQIFMSALETLAFGLLAMSALAFNAYLAGVNATTLMPSIAILLIVNALGFCSRCQSEAHARRLFRERQSAESKSEDKTLLLRQLSHNLRQPLQALSCYSMILDTAAIGQSVESLQQTVGKLNAAIDSLNNTFNHLLDIANLETGKQTPQLAAVNINTLLDALESQFAPLAAKRGLKLKIRRRIQSPYAVYSDPCILNQIIANLIDNAIKYTESGWIVVCAVKIGGNRLKLHVRDSGIGIAEELHSEIFKEFFRGHRRETDLPSQGLGIGLAYASKAAKHLPHHSLQVFSRPQRGSDFQLYLPLAEAISGKTCIATRLNLCGSFIFIVDTDRRLLNAMCEQLDAWGCLVQTATSATEMLAAFAENLRNPDLVITDFYLNNGETAHDIVAAAEAYCGPMPTLILSAHAISNTDKAKLPEDVQLLRKPTSPDVLMKVMAKIMKESDEPDVVNTGMKASLLLID